MKKTFLLAMCVFLLGASTNAQKSEVVTAAQVNGVWRYYNSDFRILALGHDKLKVQFNGQHMTRAGYPNLGEAMGEADIVGNVATFIPPDTHGCKITMTFLAGKLKVTQEGDDADCGFGHNVMATGTYRRTRAGKPKFISYPQ